jgi:hypothetical protein
MSATVVNSPVVESASEVDAAFEGFLQGRSTSADLVGREKRVDGAVVGRLVAFDVDGSAPLVVYEGQPSAGALRARASIDLHGAHIGREVLLLFENGNGLKPIVIGCLTDTAAGVIADEAGLIEVDVDGRRVVITAKNQLVLRCGKARITLTCAGKVLLEGTYISSRSSGVNRVKGGSVQLN